MTDLPKTLGPYDVVEQLGQGGMGVVYRATHRATGQSVAVKTVLAAADDVTLHALRREIRALARIRHPGIVEIIDEGASQGRPWYAMKLLEGSTLGAHLELIRAGAPSIPAGPVVTETAARTSAEGPAAAIPPTMARTRFGVCETEAGMRAPAAASDGKMTSMSARTARTVPGEVATAGLPTPARAYSKTESGILSDSSSMADTRARDSLGTVRRDSLAVTAYGAGDEPRGFDARTAPIREGLRLVHELCAPLAFLHGEGIVHRDLKPQNILVAPSGHPVIIDFGLATQFDGRLRLALQQTTRAVEGTLFYIAPEMIEGRLVDARADLYALGVILYEILCGSPPFVGSPATILRGHVEGEPPPLQRRVAGIRPDLCRLVMHLLAKRPRDRIGYVQDVAAALVACGVNADEAPAAPIPRPYLYRPGFEGRTAAIGQLFGALDRLRQGCGGAVVVGGESGTGKTRMILEAIRAASDRGIVVLASECLAQGGAPLGPLQKPLRAIADRCAEGGLETTEQILGPRGPLLAMYLKDIQDLPGQRHYPPPPLLPPREAVTRVNAALFETFAAVIVAAEAPVLLVLDDLQWADELTLQFIRYVLAEGTLASVPLLVLAAYRSEEKSRAIDEIAASARTTSIALGGLEAPAIAAMVGDMLALHPAPAFLCSELHRRAEGNPFFVAEFLLLAVDSGVLARDHAGVWRLRQNGADVNGEFASMPRSVQEVVERRLSGLSDDAEALLSVASVAGRESEEILVGPIAALTEGRMQRAETELLRQRILDDAPPGCLRFQHDKLREVAYDRLDPDRRIGIHASVADAIETTLAADRDPEAGNVRKRERAAEVAMHYIRGGRRERAIVWEHLAGQHAMTVSAAVEAVTHFESAISLSDQLPEAVVGLERKVDLRLELYAPRMHLYSAADEGNLRICLETEPLAARLGDAKRSAQLEGALASTCFARGDYEGVVAHARRAVDLADFSGRVFSGYVLSIGCIQTGRIRAVLDLAPNLITEIEQSGDRARLFGAPYPPWVTLCASVGWALCILGRRDEGQPWLARAREGATDANNPYAMALAHTMTAWALAPYELADCVTHGEQALRIARKARLVGPELFGLYAAGVGYVLGGRAKEGAEILASALATSHRLGYVAFRSEAYLGLARAHLAASNADGVATACHEGLEFGERTGERRLESEFRRLLGEVLMTRDSIGAEAHFRASLESAEQREADVYVPGIRLSLARLLVRQGQKEEARSQFARASEEVVRMDLAVLRGAVDAGIETRS